MRERTLKVELLIFDCDGVLVDSEVLAAQAYAEVLADVGVVVPPGVWARCIGRKQADIFAIIEEATQRKIGAETRDRLWPHTRELFEAGLKPTHGLVKFLESSAERRCVASSSSPERIRASLELTGLAAYFENVFSTQYVARGKPAPDIFLYASEKMGARPESVVVIEDSAPGVQGARAAGARAIGFLGGGHVGDGHGQRLIDAGAEFVSKDWLGIRDYLAKTGTVEL